MLHGVQKSVLFSPLKTGLCQKSLATMMEPAVLKQSPARTPAVLGDVELLGGCAGPGSAQMFKSLLTFTF